ncbi:SDR family NAD(P)-dependent oxidoreductase [Mycobacterium sp. E787]|uniref:SDR family NAD(P)-dependent oxidoreductase n=1 Tax=Mycobacterium sp. E787 TaxID=1834150 RepID=UPI0008011355|nr:SDR family NAD(P)-dependent oxidoreductase [Mycobacterium sp. E787]OBI48156.1 short-chain dehydrogenase [Mycobacterium sp. E787]
MGSLEGRVALITGAGRGIGRAEALFFAAEGARVVVNDRGVERNGTGADAGLAQAVVDEITVAGGNAIANSDDVTDWQGARRMIDAATEAYGDLHILVNNAGIDNHAALETITEDQFDSVIAVNLKGTFAVSRWAAHYWRGQVDQHGSGVDRVIINTASESGLTQPLPLQSNYAASKAGVAAMTIVHALELSRLGVRVNCLVPSMIRTRTSLDFVPGFSEAPPKGQFDPRDPIRIAPVAAYLASADCPMTGQFLTVRGSTVTLLRGWAPDGQVQRGEEPWTVADLAPELEALPREDVMAGLMAFFEEAVGPAELQVLADYANTYFQQSPSE